MTLAHISHLLVAAEILVFLAWLYQIWFPSSGADAAGRGLGVVYTLGLGIYILITLGFMLIDEKWSSITASGLALLPLFITVYGVIRWLKTRDRHY